MPTTTQITNIDRLLDLRAAVGDYADDFDMDAVQADYVAAVQEALPEGVTLFGNGEVHATLDAADQARDLDYREITDSIDITPILERHDRTGTGA